MSLTLLVGLARLRDQGADRVELKYAGEGDSGGLDTIQAYCGDAAVPVPDAVYNLLEQWVVDIWPQRGWENNEGAYGTITIDLTTMQVVVEHVDRMEAEDRVSVHEIKVAETAPVWQVFRDCGYNYYGGDLWVGDDDTGTLGSVICEWMTGLFHALDLPDGCGEAVLSRETHTLKVTHRVTQTVDGDVQVFESEIEC